MNFIELFGLRPGQMHQLEGADTQAGGLDSSQDLTGQITANRIWLDDRKSTLHCHLDCSVLRTIGHHIADRAVESIIRDMQSA